MPTATAKAHKHAPDFATDIGPACPACDSTLWGYYLGADARDGSPTAFPICWGCRSMAPGVALGSGPFDVATIRKAHQAQAQELGDVGTVSP